MDLKFKCKACGAENALQDSLITEHLAEQRAQLDAEFHLRFAAIEARERHVEIGRTTLEEREVALQKERASIETAVQNRVLAERATISEEEKKNAQAVVGLKIKSLEESNAIKDARLAEAQEKELRLLSEASKLEDDKRQLELTVARRIAEERQQIRDGARKELEDEARLKLAEKDYVIEQMKQQIEEAKRKGEQGSQQTQGEIQELDLLGTLTQRFDHDIVERVPKGQHGGDLIQQVVVMGGFTPGRILIDSKRTKHWSDAWLEKLRDDQRAAKADIAVLVSTALPKNVATFEFIDGIWVTSLSCAPALISALRQTLIETATARMALQKRDTTMEAVYGYLTSDAFRHRVTMMVEAISAMEDDLRAEKRAIQNGWARREKQIDRLEQATVGMYGDLQGIVGSSLKRIDGIDLPLIEAAGDTATASAAENEEGVTF